MTRRAFVLGAGASRECQSRRAKFRSPLSHDFFELLERVHGEDPSAIRVANIQIYVVETRGSYGTEKGPFATEIEAFMTEIEEKCQAGGGFVNPEWLSAKRARDELAEALPLALGRVQRGPTCSHYQRLAGMVGSDEALITLNWDTQLDRALHETNRWFVDDGYRVSFLRVFDNGWRDPDASKRSEIQYFKLHGSMNWLLNWMTYDEEGRLMISVTDDQQPLQPLCFLGGATPYETWDDDQRTALSPFSFPYFPKHPLDGMPTMSALILPVHRKSYDAFRDFLKPIWDGAERALAEAHEWVIAGYSFPRTDEQTAGMMRRAYSADKEVWIIEPFGRRQDIANRFAGIVGHNSRIRAPKIGFATWIDVVSRL
jgi:hypothetical protein